MKKKLVLFFALAIAGSASSLASHAASSADDEPIMIPHETRGMRITSVETNSIYQRIGLQPGDVVRKINGKLIRKLSDLTALENAEKKAGDYTVELLRNGNKVTLTYSVKNETYGPKPPSATLQGQPGQAASPAPSH